MTYDLAFYQRCQENCQTLSVRHLPSAGAAALEVPLTAFYGKADRKISRAMVAGWERFTTRCIFD